MKAMADKYPLHSWRRSEKSSSKSLQTRAEFHQRIVSINNLGKLLYIQDAAWRCETAHFVCLCRPRLKMHMDYCMEHPEELTKVAAVQKKV